MHIKGSLKMNFEGNVLAVYRRIIVKSPELLF